MKFIWVLLILVAGTVAVAQGEASRGKNKMKKECHDICTADYRPVCALDVKDANSSPRLFGNKCVLALHNCEHNSNLVEVDEQKCKKTGGIRLS